MKHERATLQKWYFDQRSHSTEKDRIAWLDNQYHRQLRQVKVSVSLSDRLQYPDVPTSLPTTSQRMRAPQWPILEQILFRWQETIEAKGVLVTGDILLPTSEFSVWWLQKFKLRHGISISECHGESESMSAIAIEEMKAIQGICSLFDEEDIYNMDDTGIFGDDLSVLGSAHTAPGIKKDRSRISVVFCTNVTGKTVSLLNIEATEWLTAYYQHVGTNRSVPLLMDNISSHLAVVNITIAFPNIQVHYLPKNSISVYQPLEQGIIQNHKQYYRKQCLEYRLKCFDQDVKPFTKMSLYEAIIDPVAIESVFTAVASRIYDAISLSDFLNPDGEIIEVEEEVELMNIIAAYTMSRQEEHEDEEDEEADEPSATINQALNSLKCQLSFKEHDSDANSMELTILMRMEISLQKQVEIKRSEGTLDSWFK
ncbi:putative jerky protein [Blumeria hordei DH14]|uniref:Putative jerky protein n=1 Tax=Blumeria graminis f. sp. hordei (strain DH14) TaxID=546991 RepID=N1JFZ6_BLUG1|nr:putative jerky protein [Blumeria hordei DH14]